MTAGRSGAGRWPSAPTAQSQLEFDDNLLLPALYGERDQHLDRIERQLGVSLVTPRQPSGDLRPALGDRGAHGWHCRAFTTG